MKLIISRNVKRGLQNRKIIYYTYFRSSLTKYIFKNILICKYYIIQDNSKLKIKTDKIFQPSPIVWREAPVHFDKASSNDRDRRYDREKPLSDLETIINVYHTVHTHTA